MQDGDTALDNHPFRRLDQPPADTLSPVIRFDEQAIELGVAAVIARENDGEADNVLGQFRHQDPPVLDWQKGWINGVGLSQQRLAIALPGQGGAPLQGR